MIEDGLTFQVPNPLSLSPAETSVLPAAFNTLRGIIHGATKTALGGGWRAGEVVSFDRYSSFCKLLRVWRNVILFIRRTKIKVALKKDDTTAIKIY